MRLTLTLVDPARDQRVDAVLDAEAEAPAGALAGPAARLLGCPGDADSTLYVGGAAVDPEEPLASSPICEGAVVSVGDPSGCIPPESWGVCELRVVGGPDTGGVYRLRPGTVVAGSSPRAWAWIADESMPGEALVLHVNERGACWAQARPGVTASLGGSPLNDVRAWSPGTELAVGDSVLELGVPTEADAALRPSEDGAGLDYNRPPRLLPPERPARFRLPAPPSELDRRPFPVVMAVVPLVGSVALVWLVGRTEMLAFAALSPLSILGTYVSDRRQGRVSYRRALAAYRRRRAAVEADATHALGVERAARREACPDPAALLLTATGPRRRLWERRREDPDQLLIRLGIGDLPSQVVMDDPAQDEHRRSAARIVGDVPVTVPLRERGVVGIAGPKGVRAGLGRWVVAQAAVLHSPLDLQICVLTDASGQQSWEWVRWLPHARPRDDDSEVGASALVGNDAETVANRLAELQDLVSVRQRAARAGGAGEVRFQDPDVLVVLDQARRLRLLPGVIQVLQEGPEVGVYLVCLDADEGLLPAECTAVAAVGADGSLRLAQTRTDTVTGVRPDWVSPEWCERVARSLAPIRDVSATEEEAVLPDSCRLLDVLRLEPPSPEAVAARWGVSGRSTEAVVGVSYDGPLSLDLRRDGPHGLVAGTTGAGKSELLQTLVASLAVANRPDAMTFVLVDYKGGSAFKDCVALPHTVGMVTDLDAHLVERALTSLSAELRRREHILAAADARDMEDYQRAAGHLPERAPLPRLLIVIDEFASLARELPDFVTGLVNIAQRGRSLGIHLILATQRPSGVVSPEIRANTNLRIALRVTDTAESTDVIDAPDAGRISLRTPGRAYARLGHASLLPFQSAYAGARRRTRLAGASAVLEPWLAELAWDELGQAPRRPPARAEGAEDEATDLSVLVEAVSEAAKLLGVSAQRSPWLPPLPGALLLDDLPAPPRRGELAAVPYGLEDLPAQQEQRVAVLNFETLGHLFAAGAPRTGRSQLLRTIAGSIARLHSYADVHLYGIDCGNGALRALAELPHCGAVVAASQEERAVRLIEKLQAEVRRRMDLLGARGYTDIGEQRMAEPAGERLPHIVVLIDRWEGFTSTLGEIDTGRLVDDVHQMLREGASVGVHVVIAGDHTLLAGRISALTDHKLTFRLADRADLSLIGINPRKAPDSIPDGRALQAGSGNEVQVALLARDPSGQAQAAALAAISKQATLTVVPQRLRPFRVDVLPGGITYAQAVKLSRRPAGGQLWAMAAVGGDDLAAHGPDLATGMPAFIIAGPPGSGRSTALLALARSLLAGNAKLVVLAPRSSPLRDLRGRPGITAIFDSAQVEAAQLASALGEAGAPAVVVADDAELLKDCDAAGELSRLLRGERGPKTALVLAGDADGLCTGFSGWQVEAKRARRGLLLSPQNTMDGELIGLRLGRANVGQPIQPGRGVLHLGDSKPLTVQVPLTTPADFPQN